MGKTNLDLFNKLFETLQADNEEDWFYQCFIQPKSFEQIIGSRSCLIFGESGSGKTALYRALKNHCRTSQTNEKILSIDWKPKSLPPDREDGNAWVHGQIRILFDACSIGVLEFLINHPDRFALAPEWIKVRLAWFLQNHILGNPNLRLGPLMEINASSQITKDLLVLSTEGLFYDTPSPDLAIKELLVGLKFFGIQSIWILADNIQEWTVKTSQGFHDNLVTFLSMLSIFENSGLLFKFILPNDVEMSIAHASGIIRRRLDKYHIIWDENSLKQIIERRLSLILKKEGFRLDQLCSSPEFEKWLSHFGGYQPREWLELVSPFVKHYLEGSLKKPIDSKTSKELRLNNPPRFHLDEKEFRVRIGGRVIPLNDLPPKVYSLLSYLYRHAGEIVTKENLFYQADRGLDTIPVLGDKNYVDPIAYAGQVDTNIYRIRQKIEPDPKNPVILQTERGYGVRLAVKW